MQNFDFNEALKSFQSGKPITGSDGVLAPLIKQLTEAALLAEIDSYLEQNPSSNVIIRPYPVNRRLTGLQVRPIRQATHQTDRP